MLKFTATNELDIKPSAGSSQNDFDFLTGNWKIKHKKLRSRLTNCNEWIEFNSTQEMYKVLTGIGNVDFMHAVFNGQPYEGMTVRLFNPLTRLWSIYWADNNLGVLEKPVVGSFDKETGTFYSQDKHNGQDVIQKFNWDISDPEQPVWSQALSADGGETWEWNWYMSFEQDLGDRRINQIDVSRDNANEQDLRDRMINQIDITRAHTNEQDLQDRKINQIDVSRDNANEQDLQDRRINQIDISEEHAGDISFAGTLADQSHEVAEHQDIKVIELRNYLMRPGQRDSFITLFKEKLIAPQQEMGGYPLGQYKLKEQEDRFFWIRGFNDMSSRDKFLNDFYYSEIWQKHRNDANSKLLNNDNVHLLKPLSFENQTCKFCSSWFTRQKGVAVIDYYIANQKLAQLITFMKTIYQPLMTTAGISESTFWIAETIENEFTQLPVFQDKNLLVCISFYPDETTYQQRSKVLETSLTADQHIEFMDIVTSSETLICYLN